MKVAKPHVDDVMENLMVAMNHDGRPVINYLFVELKSKRMN